MGPDGVFYEVRYTADDQGFHPEGRHINVPPFVPWIHSHGQHAEQEYYDPNLSPAQNIFNTVGTTPTPLISHLPTYSSGENIHNIFSSTFKPTTQYLPQASNSINYITGESILNANGPTSTIHPTQYIPTSTSSPVYSTTERRSLSSNTASLDPEITLFSTPKPQTQD